MRRLLIVTLVACGTPHRPPGPVQTPAAEHHWVDSPDAAPALPIDAANQGITVAECEAAGLCRPDAATTPPVDADYGDDDPESWEEDGVTVIASDKPFYCSAKNHLCEPTKADCARSYKKCRRFDAVACFTATARTSNFTRLNCLDSYGACVQIAEAFADNPEFTEVSACAVMRYQKR